MNLMSSIFVLLFLLFGLLAPRNPDYNFPLSMELIVIGFLHLALAFKPKPPPGARVMFTRLEKRLFYAALFLLVVVVTPRALYSVGIFGPVPNFCKAAGRNLQVIECLLQTAIDGPYGLRTLFQNYCALYIVMLSVFVFRQPAQPFKEQEPDDDRKAPAGLVLLSIWMVFFVGLSFVLQSIGENTVMPGWLSFTVFHNRLSTIIANPGWVWPYVAIGFVSSLSLAVSRVRNYRTFAVMSVICAFGMLATQQRGGLLVFIMVGIAFAIFPLLKRVSAGEELSRRVMLRAGFTSACVFGMAAILLFQPNFLKEMANAIGYDYKITDLKSARFAMWGAALDLASSAPLWGYGYASWLDAIAHYNATKSEVKVFDTAHNFYFQLLVELGLIFTLAHVLLMGGMVRSWFTRQTRVGRHFAVALLATSIAVILVQEIDYIRPTYYVYAMACGLVFALKRQDGVEAPDPISCGEAKRFAHWMAMPFFNHTVGALYVCLGSFFIYLFNVNAFPFEFSQSPDSYVKMTRWLGVDSKIAAGAGMRTPGRYAYFPNADQHSGINFDVIPLSYDGMPGLSLRGLDPKLPLIVGSGSMFLPYQTMVRSERGIENGSRLITKKIGYPISYSDTYLIPVSTLPRYEFGEGIVGLRCERKCVLLVSSCGIPDYFNIEIIPKGRSLDELGSVDIEVGKYGAEKRYESIRKNIVFDRDNTRAFTVRTSQGGYTVSGRGPRSSAGLVALSVSAAADGAGGAKGPPVFSIRGGACEPLRTSANQ